MSLSSAVVAELVAAGLSGEALVSACERIEAAQAQGPSTNRTARQERNARYYASKKRLKASYSDVSDDIKTLSDASRARLTCAEPEPNKTTSSPVQKDILTDIPKVPVAKPKSADAKCIAELGRVLDPEHAEAVVEHRNRLRKPMTARGAALLANSLAQAPDPNAAADEMIERGWQGWKADWGRNAQAPPRQAQNRRSLVDAINRMIPDEPQQQPGYPRLAFGR